MEAGGQLQDALLADRRALLGQEPDGDATLEGDQAVVRLLLAQDQLEQRGLAGAVGTDKAQAVLAIELERGVLEQRPAAVTL